MTSGHSLESLSSFLEKAKKRYHFGLGQPHPPSRAQASGGDGSGQNAPMHFGGTMPEMPLNPKLEAAWEDAMRIFREGQVVGGIVTGWNRGGLLIRWNELQGFVPISQLREVPILEDDQLRDETLARWVGEELALRVIELDKSRNRLVFSERATLWGPRDGERILQELAPGQVVRGHVSNLCEFGAFVDLGGIDGLVHISELSWGRVNHPRQVLRIGEEIEVYVLGVDKENRRIALSLKRLRPNPWLQVETKYHVGQVTRARITNIVDFGAFAQLEEGIEGLVHISELSDGPIGHPSEVVSLGDEVMVRILRIDSANHRLGLSMRQTGSSG